VLVLISLAYGVDVHLHGNCERERASIVWRDAGGEIKTGAVVDVHLRAR